MNIKELMTDAFHRGDIFVCHWTTCQGKEEWTVELPTGERLFEITQHNYEHIQQDHPSEEITALPCKCVCRMIIPNTVAEESTGFSLS